MRLLGQLLLLTIGVMFKRIQILFVAFFSISFVSFSFSPNIPVTGETNQGIAPEISQTHYSLTEFLPTVVNGNSSQLVGVYAEDTFALSVIQQPNSNPAFVSVEKESTTQFSLAAQYGSIGLVAHNYLAGSYFFNLTPGDLLTLIYGDGTQHLYKINQIYQYQALNPSSPYSKYIDPENPGQIMSAEIVFEKIYGVSGRLILQTCIAKGNSDSWGRLFIIAEPVTDIQMSQTIRGNSKNRSALQPGLIYGNSRILASM
jgi:hypothetical protein